MAWDATPGAACFYRLEPDFTITKALDDLTISNGLSWTPDGATMFFIDSPTQRVDRFAVSASGELTRVGTAADIPVSHGTPDGMTIDDEGCLWVALWGGNAVQRYSPSGELLARVEVDAPQVSSCAFGGPDRSTLFITTSQEGYGPADSAAHPFAGELFTIHLDVTGPVAAECSRDYALSRA
jgi:sugar lactone lactonase YvrE